MNSLKVITEAIIRDELKNSKPEIYYIEEGKLLSPAAREYLQQIRVKIEKGNPPPVYEKPSPTLSKNTEAMAKYVDFANGAFYLEKPEHMTHIFENKLVCKDHPRIEFRGKLDSLQAFVISAQVIISEMGNKEAILSDLDDILLILREIMRSDVLNQPFTIEKIIGLDHKQLREHSHNPEKYYNVKQMLLPSYKFGKSYALLNEIRTKIRECEVCATKAFKEGNSYTREDILEEFNRLSSALHIMMCKHGRT